MKKRFGLAALAAAAALLFARARRDWFPVRVEGPSMLPTLKPGDLLAVRPLRADEPRAGQLVVVRRGEIEIVKRVSDTVDGYALGADEIWLTGDNPDASTDSRTAGPAARNDVVGVVRARYKPLRSLRVF
jgi:nickel-type superoxide dismutase maturation protease